MWKWLELWAEAETPKWGLRWIARQILKLWWVRMVRGVRIYADRDELHGHRSWQQTLSSIKTMDACFVNAHSALRADVDTTKIGRLLLPDPTVKSTINYAETMEDDTLIELIKQSTKKAKADNIKVKWINEFVCYSFYIADRDGLNPYVHIEFSLPGMKIGARPAITIHKNTHPKIFQEFVGAYEVLWNCYSREPDDG